MTIFTPDQLKQVVEEALPAVPEGHTNAIVGTVDQSGAQVILSMKSESGRWTAQGAIRHEWSGENEVGANLIYSW